MFLLLFFFYYKINYSKINSLKKKLGKLGKLKKYFEN